MEKTTKEIIQETVEFEIHYSNVKTRVSEDKVIFFREKYGYIRKYDATVELGIENVGTVEAEAYKSFIKAMKERLKKMWEEEKSNWQEVERGR